MAVDRLGENPRGRLLIALLRVIEYKYYVRAYPAEVYGGLIAVLFTAVGGWLGLRWTQPYTRVLDESRGVAWPRQVAMYLARELTDQTLPAIGRAFGGRNHTTVMHACRRTAERMSADREAYETVQRLSERLGNR